MTELHLHLDGSVRPATVLELAREQGIDLGVSTREAVREAMTVPPGCTSLTDYLKRFDLPLRVLQRPEALCRVTRELVEDLAAENVTYAEIRFAPQLSTACGMSQDDAVTAAILGAQQGMTACPSIRVGLILCCMRGDGLEEKNMETLNVCSRHRGQVVCAVDLAGAEALFPTQGYRTLFARANELGLPRTIHAGEAAGPESIRAALSFGTMRLGHGIRAVEDAALVRELADSGVTLEVCPTSNLQTRAALSLQEHPIRRLFDAGVRVTVNSDNRTVSGTTLSRELALLKAELGFSESELARMEQYARAAAFLAVP